MKNILSFMYYPRVIASLLMGALMLLVFSCKEDDDMTPEPPDLTGDSETYTLNSVSDPAISGNVTFEEIEGGGTLVTIDLNGTSSGMHPAHIHANSAAEGGDIVISLETVDGTTGMSVTEVTELDNGTAISYDELLDFDGYVNVHLSEADLATLIAQGDIGGNVLTGESKTYNLEERAVEGISGTVTFEQRKNGFTLATIALEGTPEDGEHPAHIHDNSAAEGGPIAISFKPVNGTTGMSMTTIRKKDEAAGGEEVTYEDLLNYNGYVNVHLDDTEEGLQVIVAQGDIGANELTGETKTYNLEEEAVEGISGTVTFSQRKSGFTLATIQLEGTPADGTHPAHIHDNSAAEGGNVAISFNPVHGATGMSMTTIRKKDEAAGGEEVTYEDLLNYDGHVNVHLSESELGTIIAQGDIGGNELTGESITYDLEERAVEGVNGTVIFEQRKNGFTLATIRLAGTAEGIMHPAHIHDSSAAEGGPIAISFNPVDGTTGISMTTIRKKDEEAGGEEITYEDLLNYDGFVNVHLSEEDLATIIAQGDIGGNELTEESTAYNLNEKEVPGVSGTVTFTKRKNGFTLATIQLAGTADGIMHPAHIHDNSAEEGGPIAVSFTPVNGTTGISMTTIRKKDGEDGAALIYDDIITYDGYVNVHLSAEDLATLIAQGNIGSNVQ